MAMEIAKVVITDEAKFDYECLFAKPLYGNARANDVEWLKNHFDEPEYISPVMPIADIKAESEEYIEIHPTAKHRHYFHVKYYDESQGQMLMLFFYKGQKIGPMQLWDLKGICLAESWNEILEEKGVIRNWLKHGIDTEDKADWVLELRENERRGLIGSGMPTFSLNGLPREVVNAIYSGEDTAIIEKLSHLKRKGGEWVGYKRYLPKRRTVGKKHQRTPRD